MEICSVKHSSNLFHKQPGNKLVAEASALQQGNRHPLFGRVYDDTCDEGFTIVSARTGREATFAVNHVVYNNDGDVQYWELVPTQRTIRKIPSAAPFRAVVFND